MKRLLLFLVLALIAIGPAYGEDLWDPPWYEWAGSNPTNTYQAWEFQHMDPMGPFQYPTFSENPYGEPWIEESPPTSWQWVPGLDGTTEIQTIHIDVSGPFTIWVPNNPDPNEVKLIFWQMTSDKSPTPTGSGPTSVGTGGQPGTNIPSGLPHIQHGNTNWYTYNGLIAMKPNPEGEWITWDLVESTNIEEIVIKTVCTEIPEPATISLLGLAVLGLVRKLRK